MKEKYKIFITIGITVVLTVVVTVLALAYSGAAMQNAGTLTTPSDIQTYTADGFSFQYSATDFYVSDNTSAGWILVLPVAFKNNPNGDVEGIVISPRQNDSSETALDWLKSANSGYDIATQGYNTVQVGGQQAISVENGDWVVVNTPDNTERLSIAILPPSATSTSVADLSSLQSEMMLVVGSLSFGK